MFREFMTLLLSILFLLGVHGSPIFISSVHPGNLPVFIQRVKYGQNIIIISLPGSLPSDIGVVLQICLCWLSILVAKTWGCWQTCHKTIFHVIFVNVLLKIITLLSLKPINIIARTDPQSAHTISHVGVYLLDATVLLEFTVSLYGV